MTGVAAEIRANAAQKVDELGRAEAAFDLHGAELLGFTPSLFSSVLTS
jgi:hypothetical protein